MKKRKYYLLRGKEPVECDLMTWAKTFDSGNRSIACHNDDNWRLSTVFLGTYFDTREGKPLLFQTVVFAPTTEYNHQEWLYTNYDEAIANHYALLALLQAEK